MVLAQFTMYNRSNVAMQEMPDQSQTLILADFKLFQFLTD